MTANADRPAPLRASPGGLTIEGLFREYAPRVAAWARLLAGPRADVDDVVQEVFVAAHKRFDDLRAGELGEAGLRAWLYRATAHVTKRRRRHERIRHWLAGQPADYADKLAASGESPLDDLVARERAAGVHEILMSMPEKQRAVLVLFELEGLSGYEIAEATGTRVSTVWVQLHRARETFQARLAALPTGRREGLVEGRRTR
jgi:RNA polymerase sigma-70 factor (ECF subfamily)